MPSSLSLSCYPCAKVEATHHSMDNGRYVWLSLLKCLQSESPHLPKSSSSFSSSCLLLLYTIASSPFPYLRLRQRHPSICEPCFPTPFLPEKNRNICPLFPYFTFHEAPFNSLPLWVSCLPACLPASSASSCCCSGATAPSPAPNSILLGK